MGRHSGAVCQACQQCILVRDGRFIEHAHLFPTLGKSLPCVGSLSRAPDDWALQESLTASPALSGGSVRTRSSGSVA